MHCALDLAKDHAPKKCPLLHYYFLWVCDLGRSQPELQKNRRLYLSDRRWTRFLSAVTVHLGEYGLDAQVPHSSRILGLTGAVNTQGFVWKFFYALYINFHHSFIHSNWIRQLGRGHNRPRSFTDGFSSAVHLRQTIFLRPSFWW